MDSAGTQRDWQLFRAFAIAAGMAASVLFVLVGVATRLEIFGDGSIFSYAVAAQDAWAFHWHNISGRLFTYLFAYVVPEQIVGFTGNARAAIAAYGVLFFSGPLIGVLVTFAADYTAQRALFTYACLSTACLCPFVYGTPTEMWMAHALFWPALTICICAPLNWSGVIAVFVAVLALILTHEGAILLALSILIAMFLRGWRDTRVKRACMALCAAMIVWTAVKLTLKPDDYIAGVLHAAAFRFINPRNLAQPAFLTLTAALVGDLFLTQVLRALGLTKPYFTAALLCVVALAVFWVFFDRWLLTEARYDLRTLLLICIPTLGVLASLHTMTPEEWDRSPAAFVGRWYKSTQAIADPRALAGALALILLAHTVETGKFVVAWTQYKAAVRALASGSASDPPLGNPLFVSAQRLPAGLNRLAWNSTTPFLSILVAPELTPTRLVVDPSAGYFWLSCPIARQSERTSTAIPEPARRLVRLHACLHRPD